MIDALYSLGRHVAKHRRFDRVTTTLGAELSTWSSARRAHAVAQECLRVLEACAPAPLEKGAPDLLALKQAWGRALAPLLRPDSAPTSAGALADKIAAVTPLDENARRLALAVFYLCHAQRIADLRTRPAPYLALHMSCTPRLVRAQASQDSFAAIPPTQLAHLKLVGNGREYRLDLESQLLEVPALDSYEHLPAKVIDAFALLAFVPGLKAVIKLDDDHRLGEPRALLELLDWAAGHKAACQIGNLYHCAYPAAHSHGWHLGKCRDPAVAEEPFGFPAPLSWSTGEFGYIVNRPALLRMLWARLYYRRWIGTVLYEDIAMGELAEKLGIRKKHRPLDPALRFHRDY